MPNKIIVSSSRNGEIIIANYKMVNENNEVISDGSMSLNLLHTDAMDYSQSPPVLMTQKQRIEHSINQVKENLQRLLKLVDAGDVDGDLVVSALNGLEIQ